MKYTEPNENALSILKSRGDPNSIRIQRMLGLPELTKKEHSPVCFIVDAIKNISILKGYDLVEIPEIVSVEKNFDLLGMPQGHPARSEGDTFYVNETFVLRTQMTTMWSYYLKDNLIREKLKKEGQVRALSYGKVYRNDEIDRCHYPVFHQIDGLNLCKKSKQLYSTDDLADVLVAIARSVYGQNVEYRIEDDTFPFTEPSIQLLIKNEDEWLEVLGAGIVSRKVLSLLDLNPDEYNGWAFGIGLDRLALIKMAIPDIRILWSGDERITKQFTSIDSKYEPVSKYPPVHRDISFLARKDIPVNLYYELMRECGWYDNEDIIEEVKCVDIYSNKMKFLEDRVSYTFRIRYRSHTRSLTNNEINEVQERLRCKVVEEFGAVLR